MSDFKQACPSGNTLVDCYHEQKVYSRRITDKKQLREYIRHTACRLTIREMIDLYRELRYMGYVEVTGMKDFS